jgi:hypothetical protein
MQAFESTRKMESAGTLPNPPIEVGKSQGWRLAGLLTRASMNLNGLPGTNLPVAELFAPVQFSALTVTG